ncbi:MAG TPA: transposase, partial [Ignavibacteriales bacterium]|nr:transposase [Ignavibacteriales bacterium]
EIKCIYNKTALSLLKQAFVPKEAIDELLRAVEKNKVYLRSELERIIDGLLRLKNRLQVTPKVIDAMAIAYYRIQKDSPVVKHLMSDEAGEYGNIVPEQSSCWVHDARNYKKLSPFLKLNRDIYERFMDRYWKFYKKLLKYRKKPTREFSLKLEQEFDRIFSTRTVFEELNYRIEKTMAHKKKLLLVLKYPYLPLHNNIAEIALRRIVRKRDISLHTMSRAGTILRDSVLSVVETAQKLNVSAYEYLADRIKRTYKMPSLASLIANR